MTPADPATMAADIAARVLAQRHRRVAVFGHEMAIVLDGLALRYPRSTPRELARMARR